jgi:hypothetical protein
MANYQAFIQKCSVKSIAFEEKINYIAYGSNSTSGIAIPFNTDPIETSIISPNSTKILKLIVTGDWS